MLVDYFAKANRIEIERAQNQPSPSLVGQVGLGFISRDHTPFHHVFIAQFFEIALRKTDIWIM
jgi:hypothetical protein